MPGFLSKCNPEAEHYKLVEQLSQQQLEWIAQLPMTIRVPVCTSSFSSFSPSPSQLPVFLNLF